jgi:flagellar basal body-associated protein FliL
MKTVLIIIAIILAIVFFLAALYAIVSAEVKMERTYQDAFEAELQKCAQLEKPNEIARMLNEGENL